MADEDGPGMGHNTLELNKLIAEVTREIAADEKQREAINARINEKRKRLKSAGVDLDAWRLSYRRFKMDPDVRAELDRSLAIINEALGIPAQGTLFEDDDLEQHKIPESVN